MTGTAPRTQVNKSSLRSLCGAGFLLTGAFLFAAPFLRAQAVGDERYVEFANRRGDFPIIGGGAAAAIYVDPGDYPGVLRAAKDLKTDIERVTERITTVSQDERATLAPNAILVATVGRSTLLARLIDERRIDVTSIAGKWECFLIQVVEKPLPGVESALVIAGSDKRGTIFGIYDLSNQIGVSPWYWWADVPVRHHDELFVKPGTRVQGPPAVK